MATLAGDLAAGTTDSFYSSPLRIDFQRSADFAALGSAADTVAPVVGTFSPSAASSVARTDALTFHVTDDQDLASIIVSVAQGSDPAEIAYNGSAFVAPYLASSTLNAITDGFSFSLTRTAGWQRSSITVRVTAVDTAGNVTTETASFTVTNPPPGPVIDTFSPSASSSILLTDSVSFHVTDETALASAVVLVTQGSDPVEVAHNGSAFVGPYLASSTRSVITGGYAFVLVRDAGWQRSALTVAATAVDGQGNVTSASAAYTVTNPPAAPVIGSYSPSAAASITRTTALTYHVTDETSLGPVLVWATQGSDPVETVHDGSSFVAPYAAGSTRSSISGGYAYSIVRAGGWQRSALTLSTKAVDGQGNVTTSTASFTVTNPPAAPAVDTFSPAAAASILRTAALTFHVTDETSLAVIDISVAQGSDPVEVIYNGSFVAPYAAGSTRSSISDGYSFSLVRAGGWQRSAITLTIRAVDGQGNVTTTTAAFTVTNPPGAPTVGTFSPADSSSISKTTAATFHVTDETLLLRAVVYATHSTGLVELVHDGSAFKAPYAVGSTRSSISGGYAFAVSRTGNWPAAGLVLTIIASDAQGNETTGTYTLTITDAPAVDAEGPVVSNITPAAGSALAATTALGFDVTDDSGLFRRITVALSFGSGRPDETVYDSRGFRPYYSAGSTVTSIEGGLRFSVKRTGGWPAAPSIYIDPIDLSGNEV